MQGTPTYFLTKICTCSSFRITEKLIIFSFLNATISDEELIKAVEEVIRYIFHGVLSSRVIFME